MNILPEEETVSKEFWLGTSMGKRRRRKGRPAATEAGEARQSSGEARGVRLHQGHERDGKEGGDTALAEAAPPKQNRRGHCSHRPLASHRPICKSPFSRVSVKIHFLFIHLPDKYTHSGPDKKNNCLMSSHLSIPSPRMLMPYLLRLN